MSERPVVVSVVIPVYNGETSIARVVEEVHREVGGRYSLEVVLVNDGSPDNSAAECRRVAALHGDSVVFVNLARNFGEHNAVLAGISQSTGDVVAVIDDDGQNPPAEIPKLVEAVLAGHDVAYGRFMAKHHAPWRNLGSRVNNLMATWLIGKPADLYLSSFKAMNRLVADHLSSHPVPNLYLDSLIFQCTNQVTQVDVLHSIRQSGRSNYTLVRLIRLWLNMLTTASTKPLRFATYIGLAIAVLGILGAAWMVFDYVVFGVDAPGWTSLFVAICLFSSFQFMALGVIGEYTGRIFQSGHRPPFVIREIRSGNKPPQ